MPVKTAVRKENILQTQIEEYSLWTTTTITTTATTTTTTTTPQMKRVTPAATEAARIIMIKVMTSVIRRQIKILLCQHLFLNGGIIK